MKLLLEGVDRLGKSTVINGLLDRLGYHQVIHFDKPKALACYRAARNPLLAYQESSFTNLLRLLSCSANIICDRSHIGEAVYAELYRHYDGSYVFDLEDMFISNGSTFHERTMLILLTTDNFEFIKDDGQSFDVTKREEEQNRFTKAVQRSRIINKRIINVHDGRGAFKPPHQILDEILL